MATTNNKNNNNTRGFFKSIGNLFGTTASASVDAVEMVENSIGFVKDEVAPTVGKGFRTLSKVADATFNSIDNLVDDWEAFNKKEAIKSKVKRMKAEKLYSSKEYEELVEIQVLLELKEELSQEFSDEEVEKLLKTLDNAGGDVKANGGSDTTSGEDTTTDSNVQ